VDRVSSVQPGSAHSVPGLPLFAFGVDWLSVAVFFG
jgi:hypothetical protein